MLFNTMHSVYELFDRSPDWLYTFWRNNSSLLDQTSQRVFNIPVYSVRCRWVPVWVLRWLHPSTLGVWWWRWLRRLVWWARLPWWSFYQWVFVQFSTKTGWLGGLVVSVVACNSRSREFDTHSPCAAVAQWGWWFEPPTTVIPVTQRSWADCLLTVMMPRRTQPSIPPALVNEDQPQLE